MGKPRKTRSDGLEISQDKPQYAHCLACISPASARLASLKVFIASALEKNFWTTSLLTEVFVAGGKSEGVELYLPIGNSQ